MGAETISPVTNEASTRYAVGVEYDGSRFHGWQSQSGVSTVQDWVEEALARVASEAIQVVTAGRTDTGVHATGQVAHFDSGAARSPLNWLRGANTHLPTGLALMWVKAVDPKFHARFTALARRYRYILFCRDVRPTYLSGKVTWTYERLDVSRMRHAATALIGEHDFSAFRASGCQSKVPVREIYELSVNSQGPWIWIDIEADGFLQHMVRNITGVLMAIATGSKPISWAGEILESRDRTAGGVTASPDGLYFTGVRYPESFELPSNPDPCRFW